MSGPNQPTAAEQRDQEPARAEQQHQAADAEAEQERERRLAADEPLHGHPGRPAGVVELVLERRAPARAQARRQPRAEPGRERLDELARSTELPLGRLAHAADAPAEPLDRARVAQHRDRRQPEREAEHRQAAEQQRHRHQLDVDLRRPADQHERDRPQRCAATITPGDPDRRARHRLRHAGRHEFSSRIVPAPMPATT